MNLDHDLLREIRKQEKQREKENLYYAEEPDWMIYEQRGRNKPLNEYKGIFDATDETSINKAPSIFDKGTIFKTGETGRK